MTRYIIDRIEDGDWAVLEGDGEVKVTIPRSWLPVSAREGDVVTASQQDELPHAKTVRFEIDAPARVASLDDARRLRDALPRGPKGDISV